MKAFTTSLGIATIAIASLFSLTPTARAAYVTLDGYGTYRLSNFERYSPRGAYQGGRYRNLGADYYRKSRIGIDAISNRSRFRSGSLSFELWALPFFGANSGTVLMTSNANRLNPRRSLTRVFRYGNAVSLDRWAFPELNLWEFTRRGWRFKDAVSFGRRDLL